MGGRHLTLCAIPHPPTMSDYGGETFYGAPVEIVGGHPNVTLKKVDGFLKALNLNIKPPKK